MSEELVIVEKEKLTAIANAVRTSTSSSETFNVSELSAATVEVISAGGGECSCLTYEQIQEDLASGAVTPESTVTWHDTGLTLADLKEYNEIAFIFYCEDGNTNVPSQVRFVVANKQEAAYNYPHIANCPTNNSGLLSCFRWMDKEKLFGKILYYANTAYQAKTSNYATTTFPKSGLSHCGMVELTYVSTPSEMDAYKLWLVMNIPTATYSWKIRGVK